MAETASLVVGSKADKDSLCRDTQQMISCFDGVRKTTKVATDRVIIYCLIVSIMVACYVASLVVNVLALQFDGSVVGSVLYVCVCILCALLACCWLGGRNGIRPVKK